MREYVAKRREWPKVLDRRSFIDRVRGRPGRLTRNTKPWGLYRDGLFIGAYDSAEEAVAAMPLEHVEVQGE